MTEIKKRDSYYCNLKFLLLYMVVFGHWIEPYVEYSPWGNSVYRIIYTVHMPLFIFLSGSFLTSCEQAKNQALRFLSYYLIVQTMVVLIGKISGGSYYLFQPCWHLWYLLSLSLWCFLVWISEQWAHLSQRPAYVRVGVILLAVGIGCGAGCLPWVNRNISLSRTLVFLPYLLAGYLCPRDIFRGRRVLGIVSLLSFGGLYFCLSPYIPTDFFYQADPYGILGDIPGIRLRLACYLMGGLFGIGLLALIPERRFALSHIGTDTLWIYLCHAPLVTLLRLLPLSPLEMILAGPLVSLWIICLLCRLFRWRGQLYAVCIRRIDRKVNKYDFQTNL